jgi:hypothetical protein
LCFQEHDVHGKSPFQSLSIESILFYWVLTHFWRYLEQYLSFECLHVFPIGVIGIEMSLIQIVMMVVPRCKYWFLL